MPSPLPRRTRCWDVAPLKAAAAAFPYDQQGRLPHQRCRGLRGVHSRYSLPARRVAQTTPYTRGFGSFVTSTTAPIATGWSNSCQGGLPPTEELHLSRRTGRHALPVARRCFHENDRRGFHEPARQAGQAIPNPATVGSQTTGNYSLCSGLCSRVAVCLPRGTASVLRNKLRWT